MRFILCFLCLSLTACATGRIKEKSLSVNVGDPKSRVIEILGTPEDRQMKDKQEAWQYCETGGFSDNFTVVWFLEGKVSGLNHYTHSNSVGSCSGGFKSVQWEDAPTQTIEVRSR